MGSAETERPLGEVFDSVAEDYDLVRQGYPAVLVDAAVARGRLVDGSRVLEVGCGTGKLTEVLAARHLNVDAVDPGPRMIEQAKRRVGGNDDVRFHIGRFEDVALPEAAFDALFSATAFHWVDPLPHHRHQLHGVGGHCLVEDALQERQIDLATDEGAVVRPSQIRAKPRPRRRRGWKTLTGSAFPFTVAGSSSS